MIGLSDLMWMRTGPHVDEDRLPVARQTETAWLNGAVRPHADEDRLKVARLIGVKMVHGIQMTLCG